MSREKRYDTEGALRNANSRVNSDPVAAKVIRELVVERDVLLEALERLSDIADGFNVSGVYFTEDDVNWEALEAAEAAIAKVYGEDQQ